MYEPDKQDLQKIRNNIIDDTAHGIALRNLVSSLSLILKMTSLIIPTNDSTGSRQGILQIVWVGTKEGGSREKEDIAVGRRRRIEEVAKGLPARSPRHRLA